MKKNVFLVVVLLAMFMLVGCGQDYDNKYFAVTDDFINGYGSEGFMVYIQAKDGNLYAVGDATDSNIYKEYGVGLDFEDSYGVTGIYLPLSMDEQREVHACLSYGDIAPVVFKKSKDTLYSKQERKKLTLRPVEYLGKKDYATAMEEYEQVSDDFANVSDCRCYKVFDDEAYVYSASGYTGEGTMYDTSNLKPGLYFVDDSYGIIEVR